MNETAHFLYFSASLLLLLDIISTRYLAIRSMEEEEGEEEEAGTTGSFQPRRKSPNRSSSQAPRVTTSLELACGLPGTDFLFILLSLASLRP